MTQELISVNEVPPEVESRPATTMAISEGEKLIAQATAFQVTNPDTYREGSEVIQRLAGAWNSVEKERKYLKEPHDTAVKRLQAFFNKRLDAIADAKEIIRKKLLAWDAEQKRIADEARRRAEAEERQRKEAQEREAAELRRKAAEESERIASEARARQAAEDKARQDAEAARKAGDEQAAAAANEQARLERMERLRLENQQALQAEELNEQATAMEVQAAMPTVLPSTPTPLKVVGQSRRQVAKYEITDPNQINDAFWVLDDKGIAAMVHAKGADAALVIGKGIKIWLEDDLSFRART